LDLPTGQLSQVCFPPGENFPVGQFLQRFALASDFLPGGHDLHFGIPSLRANLPAVHSGQVFCSAIEKLPLGQFSHAAQPLSANFPALQM
jgi:hypothetical protein